MTINLVLLHLRDFDIILGLDWLSKYRAMVDCFNKTIRFNLEGFTCVSVVGKRNQLRPVLFQL